MGLERRNQHLFKAIAPAAIVANVILILHQHLTYAEIITDFRNSTSDSSWAINEVMSEAMSEARGFRSFDELRTLDFAFLACLLVLGLELNSAIVKLVGDKLKRSDIPVRGHHLDYFSPVSKAQHCVWCQTNKLTNAHRSFCSADGSSLHRSK